MEIPEIGISTHEAIMKAKELAGHVDPASQPVKPSAIISSVSPKQWVEILTESSSCFVRSLSTRPRQATDYLETRSLDYKKLSEGLRCGHPAQSAWSRKVLS